MNPDSGTLGHLRPSMTTLMVSSPQLGHLLARAPHQSAATSRKDIVLQVPDAALIIPVQPKVP